MKNEKAYIESIKKIYKQVDRICENNKDCDKSTVLHTLLLLKKPPLKRLEMSLRRAKLMEYWKKIYHSQIVKSK